VNLLNKEEKLKGLITDIRNKIFEDIEIGHKTIMALIKGCFDARLNDEGMKADKVRARMDAFRNKMNNINPVMKIYKKHESKMLKEKKRFRGIILLLETFLVEITYLREQAQEGLWLVKNPGVTLDGEGDSLSELLDSMVHKVDVFDESVELFENFYESDLGQDTEAYLKENLLKFFKKKEIKKMIRLVKRENLDKLEHKYLEETDLVQVTPEDFKEKFEDEEEEENFTSMVPMAAFVPAPVVIPETPEVSVNIPLVTPAPLPEPVLMVEQKVVPVEIEPPVAPGEEVAVIPDQKESHLANFFRKIFDKGFNDEDVSSYILIKGNEFKEEGRSTDSLSGVYLDMIKEHPDWKISPKKFLKLVKELTKTGIVSKLEKLPTGYYMIHFHPVELTKDPSLIIALARKNNGVLGKDDIISGLQWSEYRVDASLDFLILRKIARTDTSYVQGTRYYFMID
jgi:hypothetical protein